jgi:hypothetical protein
MDGSVRDAILDCTRLKPGWDSYDGAPTSEAAAVAAQRFLDAVGTPPHVAPRSDGGIQLEWHVAGFDIEVSFDEDGTVEFWAVEA